MEIKFKDLSVALKTAVVVSYVVGITYVLAFLVGFIGAVLR